MAFEIEDPLAGVMYVGIGWLGYTLLMLMGGLWGQSAAFLDPSVPLADLLHLVVAWLFVFAPLWIGLPWITWNLYQAHLEELAEQAGPVPRSERGARRSVEPVERTPIQMYVRLTVALVISVVLSAGILVVLPLPELDEDVLELQLYLIAAVFMGVFGLAVR